MPSANGFSCSLATLYSMMISSIMSSNLLSTLIQEFRSERGHFQESTVFKMVGNCSFVAIRSLAMRSASWDGYIITLV